MSDQNFNAQTMVDMIRVQAILKSNIFASENAKHPLKQSAFTELMICLHDLLQKSKKSGVEVEFTDEFNEPIHKSIDKIIDYGQCQLAAQSTIPHRPLHSEIKDCPFYQALSK